LAAVAAKVPEVRFESGHYHECLIAQLRCIPENVTNCPSLSKVNSIVVGVLIYWGRAGVHFTFGHLAMFSPRLARGSVSVWTLTMYHDAQVRMVTTVPGWDSTEVI